jgi:hypothetical protein
MPDLLRQGLQWLEQQRTEHCSSPVEYRRGLDTYDVQATKGKTEFEVSDDFGATIGTHVVDFLIMADELGLKPQPGDVIVSDEHQYEVMNLGSEGCWRYSDPNLITLRIHTKEVGTA